MKHSFGHIALSVFIALAGWHCARETGSSAPAPTIDSVVVEQFLFAGWVDTITQPILIQLEVREDSITGSVEYVKDSLSVPLLGIRHEGTYALMENQVGKIGGDWSFYWDAEESAKAKNPEELIEGRRLSAKEARVGSPVWLHPIPQIPLDDAMLQRYEGAYGDPFREDMMPADEHAETFSALRMRYLGARHFEFEMINSGPGGYGCGADDGCLVMVAPDTAMFWGLDACAVRFVFHADTVTSEMLHWGFSYCGAGPTDFNANMKRQ